jgi:hypothetical protein
MKSLALRIEEVRAIAKHCRRHLHTAAFFRPNGNDRLELYELHIQQARTGLQRQAIGVAADVDRIGAVTVDAADATHGQNNSARGYCTELLVVTIPKQRTHDIVAIPKKIDHLAASKRLNPDLLCVRSDVIENNPTGTLRDEDRSRIGISGQMTLSQAVSIGGERNTDCG